MPKEQLLKHPLKPHQAIAPTKMLAAKRFCLFDTVGVGKTIEAIAAIQTIENNHAGCFKTLIVAESSALYQWKGEIAKFCDIETEVVPQKASKEKRKKLYKAFAESYSTKIMLINYGKLRCDFDELIKCGIYCVVFDEAALLSNKNQTRDFAKWLSRKAEYVFALTATPISRSAEQFYDIFDCIGVAPISKRDFTYNYTLNHMEQIYTPRGVFKKLVIDGFKNVDLLNQYYGKYYLRRTKKDISKDGNETPKNIYYRLYKMDAVQKQAYKELKEKQMFVQKEPDEEGKLVEFTPLTTYTAALQILDSAHLMNRNLPRKSNKIDGLLDLVPSFNGEKVFIYSKFREFGFMIQEALGKDRTVFLHGQNSQMQIEEDKQAFLNNPDIQFCVATDIAQRGLNLQVASTVVFMDLPFTPDAIYQLIGRVDRIGQQSPFINVFFLMMDDSIEFRIFDFLYARQKVFDSVFDESSSEMFNISKEAFTAMM